MSEFMILISNALSEFQRDLIHEAVKSESDVWWHQHEDIWIFETENSAHWWRVRLEVIVPRRPAAIIVMRLPPEGGRKWAAKGPKYKWGWLNQMYASPGGGAADPDFFVPEPPQVRSLDEPLL